MAERVDLSIIIINYKSAALLADCLRTVYAQTARISFEVIVVDNMSNDDSRRILTEQFPSIRWVQMDYNAGFARANNAGYRVSTGNMVLLLNPDTLIVDHAIENCCEALLPGPYMGAGVQLLNPDGTPQISGNYAMRGGLNYLLPLPYLGNFIKKLGNTFKVSKPNVPDSNDTIEVDWINGAFLMVKRVAWEAAGGLDEEFFLYAEEAEWCSRLKKAGKLCIFGQYKVIHLQGETANETFGSAGKGYYNLYDRKGLQIMVSNFLRIRKEFGAGWFLLDLAVYFFEIFIFPLGLLIDKCLHGKRARYHWEQVPQYLGNVFRLIGLSPYMLARRRRFYKVL
ncbi:MAG TPA: glycosyltransferase family 2 protein [Chitinophagaceae bacterium]|nr:glycosyltransferase family 2 protein [Chitinophagaceae bacterium]